MICYHCGCNLTAHDFCTNCGAEVGLYKKIMAVSNLYYNEGLEKAGVRDLSGAIVSLRQSLKFNKNNIEARNLLGLVYFEMGEVVAALGEWVISKNMRPNKNIADDYINMVQSNATKLDTINQTIKKYNQALIYCHQDSKDMAIIQLKKVLSLNPKFIRAHQLLALLYIDAEEWEKAERELKKCCQIDTNNTTVLRYKKLVDKMLLPDESVKVSKSKKLVSDVIHYQRDNETIIQPVGYKEHKGISSVINIIIGVAIGIAVAFFLILPARISSAKAEAKEELKVISEQSDAKSATITELESKVAKLTEENNNLHEKLDIYVGSDGTLQIMDDLLSAAKIYAETPNEIEAVAEYLDAVDNGVEIESTSKEFQDLYNLLVSKIGVQASTIYYNKGMEQYNAENYDDAITYLLRAYEYNNQNGEALYNLGNSYRLNEQSVEAVEIYRKVTANFAGTEKARRSAQYIEELTEVEE
jgi:tetratricopeptide (TPR) repeat protein